MFGVETSYGIASDSSAVEIRTTSKYHMIIMPSISCVVDAAAGESLFRDCRLALKVRQQ